jgi:hypothetical protein
VWRAALVYLVLAVAATWPLAAQLDRSVPHDLGDPLLVTYLLNWNALVPPLTERWWHPPFFWPTPNVMALSEPVLGLSLFATPLRWLGLGALATYNVLFIASFWTAGLGGWFLGKTLTGRWLPALIGGLVYMLAPYRYSHLPHLQLLACGAVPVMFAALHRALGPMADRPGDAGSAPAAVRPAPGSAEWRWTLVAAVCWVWQGLVSGYFLAFLPIGVLLWLVWFARDRLSLWLKVAAASAAGGLLLVPMLSRYAAVHADGGFKRQLVEVLEFSADVAGLWQVSDRLAIWGRLLPKGYAEEQLFPGLATVALVIVAMTAIPRPLARARRVTWALVLGALALIGVAAVAATYPFVVEPFGVRISVSHPHKPLGIAWVLLIAAACTTRTMAAAFARRSPEVGYLLLAVISWILALGPAPTVTGERIWYSAPYLWLYRFFPGFTEFRVPARLFVVTLTAFAALGALGADRILRLRRAMAVPLVLVLALAVIAEGWLARMPLAPAPVPLAIPDRARLVIELPAGDAARDSVAMYRSLFHGRPVANGWSGYEPPSMRDVVRIERGDEQPLLALARQVPLAVVIDPQSPSAARYTDLLARVHGSCAPQAGLIVCLVDHTAGS